MAIKKKASKKKTIPKKRGRPPGKKTVTTKRRPVETEEDLFGERGGRPAIDKTAAPTPGTGIRGRTPSLEMATDGIWMGANVFAEEVTLNNVTVQRRVKASEIRTRQSNVGVPLYRLKDLIRITYQTDESGKVDVDKLNPIQRHAHYKAETERQKMLVGSGQLLEAAAVEKEMARQATIVKQFCDTLPDVLERDCGLTGEVLTKLESRLDLLREDLHKKVVGEEPGEAHQHK